MLREKQSNYDECLFENPYPFYSTQVRTKTQKSRLSDNQRLLNI